MNSFMVRPVIRRDQSIVRLNDEIKRKKEKENGKLCGLEIESRAFRCSARCWLHCRGPDHATTTKPNNMAALQHLCLIVFLHLLSA